MRGGGGRISAASQTVIAGKFGKRPDPPKELNKEQGDIWREVVASENADFFSTAALRGLLADYCRRRQTSERLTAVMERYDLDRIDDIGWSEYRDLARLRDMEQKAVMQLATKMRITNQARYTTLSAATAAKRAAKEPEKLWEKFTG
jgi:hypothetical protein